MWILKRKKDFSLSKEIPIYSLSAMMITNQDRKFLLQATIE
jgi:hypothetical protein